MRKVYLLTCFILCSLFSGAQQLNKLYPGISAKKYLSLTEAVVKLDLDGDGKPDFVAVNNGRLYFLKDFRTFNGQTFYDTIGSSFFTYFIVMAGMDINQDGKDDLVGIRGNNIVYYRNSSDSSGISFDSSFNIVSTTSSSLHLLLFEDLDSNGKKEFIHGHFNNSTIRVLPNTSSGGNVSFGTALTYTGGIGLSSLAVKDVNGDNKPELIGAYTNNNLSVFRNTSAPGSVSFATYVTFPAGRNPQSLSVKDFDMDGKADIFCTNPGDRTFSVLRNTCTGSALSFKPRQSFSAGKDAALLSSDDFDKDNKPDLLIVWNISSNVSSVGSNHMFFYRNLSDTNSFYFERSYESQGTGLNNFFLHLNADSLIDMLSFNGDFNAFENISRESRISFNYPKEQRIGFEPLAMVFEDVDYDTKTDVLLTSPRDNSIIIYHNIYSSAGNFNFRPATSWYAGIKPYKLAAAKLDSDNYPDVAVTNPESNKITILRNLSGSYIDILMDTIIEISAGNSPKGIVLADFDGDSKTDMAVSNFADNNLYVYRNTSSSSTISFASPVTLNAGLGPDELQAADVDGDSKKDLVCVNTADSMISIFRNSSTGSGSISFASRSDIVSGFGTVGLAIADLDNSSLPEILSTNILKNQVSFYPNNSSTGSISFGARTDSSSYGEHPISIHAGDLAGTNKNAVIFGNYRSNTWHYMLNNSTGSGNYTFGRIVSAYTNAGPAVTRVFDLDQDNKNDIVMTDVNDYSISVLGNTRMGFNLSFANAVTYRSMSHIDKSVACDIDKDSVPDIILHNRASNQLHFFKNVISNDTPVFTMRYAIKPLYSSTINDFLMADLDGDDREDILCIGATIFQINRNLSVPGKILFKSQTTFNPSMTTYHVSVGDFNADGKKDVVLGAGTAIGVMPNTSTGAGNFSFGTKVALSTGGSGSITVLDTGDFDNDGKTDLVAGLSASGAGYLAVFRNTSSGSTISFASPAIFNTTYTSPRRMGIYNINNDPRPDLYVIHDGGKISFYRNRSSGSGSINFSSNIDISFPHSSLADIPMDLDHDGRPDFIFPDRMVYLNKHPDTSSVTLTLQPYALPFTDNRMHLFEDFDLDGLKDLAVVLQNKSMFVTAGITTFINLDSFQQDLCAGDSFPVGFSLSGIYIKDSLDIRVQLSDSSGAFSSGSREITRQWIREGEDTVLVITPRDLLTSSKYKIRLISVLSQDTSNSSLPFRVKSLPSARLRMSGSDKFCAGDSAILIGDSLIKVRYQWYKNGQALYLDTITILHVDTTGAYHYIVTDSNGCANPSVDTLVQMFYVPRAGFKLNDSLQCHGNEIFLSDTSSIAAGLLSRRWYINDTLRDSVSNWSFHPSDTIKYSIRLISFHNQICADTASDSAWLRAGLNMRIVHSDTSQCLLGNNFNLIDSSMVLGGARRFWYSDEGFFDSTQSVSVHFSMSGQHLVRLVIHDSLCSDTASVLLRVKPSPVAKAGLSDTMLCLNEAIVSFSNFSTDSFPGQKSWFIASQLVSSSDSFGYSFDSAGSYTGYLYLKNTYGCADSTFFSIKINPNPRARFQLNDSQQCLNGNYFQLRDSSSGYIARLWSLSGSFDSSAQITRSYTDSGSYGFSLVVYNEFTCFDTASGRLIVDPSPQARAGISDSFVCLNEALIHFNNLSTDDFPDQKNWYLGSEFLSSSDSFTRQFDSAGTYSGSLHLQNTYGCADSTAFNIQVNPLPQARFVLNDSQQCLRTNLFVLLDSSAGNNRRSWIFPGFSDSSAQLLRSYTDSGTYHFSLLVSNQYGCKDSATGKFRVDLPPEARILMLDSSQCQKQQLFAFYDTSINYYPASRIWFIDGQTWDTAKATLHHFDSIGPHSVKLLVGDYNGCTDSIEKMLLMRPSPTALFDITDSSQCHGSVFSFMNFSIAGSSSYSSSWAWLGKSDTSMNLNAAIDSAGLFKVRLIVKNSEQCKDTLEKQILVFPKPGVQNISGNSTAVHGSTETYSAIDRTGSTYQWFIQNGTQLSGADSAIISVSWSSTASLGIIKVLETDSNGCVSDTASLQVSLGPLGSSGKLAGKFLLYPNPSSSQLTLRTDESGVFQIYDINGRLLRSGTKENIEDISISVSEFASGSYLLKWVSAKGVRVLKFEVIKE